MTSLKIFDTVVDTTIFAITKLILSHIPGHESLHLHGLNFGDVGVYATIDAVYNLVARYYIGMYAGYKNEKYSHVAFLAIFVSVLNHFMDRHRIIDNLISIGASSIVTEMVNSYRLLTPLKLSLGVLPLEYNTNLKGGTLEGNKDLYTES